jgi:hypothetical protein
MTWDIFEKIIVGVIVAVSAAYLAVRVYKSVFQKGRDRGLCADCPTRSHCEAALSATRKGEFSKGCPQRGPSVRQDQ